MKGSLKPGNLKVPNFKLNHFKLTREMKLALTGVALIGAVGGWYTWSTSRAPEIAENTAPSASTPAPAQSAAPTDSGAAVPTASASPARDAGRVTIVRPKNPVKVEQIPFLTTRVVQESAAKPAPAVTAAPQQDTLSNPFRPFEVQKSEQASASSNGQASAPAISVPPVSSAPRVPIIAGTPNVPTSGVTGAGLSPIDRARAVAGGFSGGLNSGQLNGGAARPEGLIASPPIVLTPPKISGAVPFPRVRPSTPNVPSVPKPNVPRIAKTPSAPATIQVPNAVSAPSIPSAPPIALRAPDVVPVPPVPGVPIPSVPSVSAGTPLPMSGAASVTPPTLATAPAATIPAIPIPEGRRIKPPTPILSVPGSVSVGALAAQSSETQSSETQSPETQSPETQVQDAAPTSVPPLIAELEAPADQTAQAAPVSPLAAFVQEQDLTFSAAVLGSVNTGILNAKDGYLVVTVGQTLPDSKVVVKDITATSVTLALGDEQKVLELGRADAPETLPQTEAPQNASPDQNSGRDDSTTDGQAADTPTSTDLTLGHPASQTPASEHLISETSAPDTSIIADSLSDDSMPSNLAPEHLALSSSTPENAPAPQAQIPADLSLHPTTEGEP